MFIVYIKICGYSFNGYSFNRRIFFKVAHYAMCLNNIHILSKAFTCGIYSKFDKKASNFGKKNFSCLNAALENPTFVFYEETSKMISSMKYSPFGVIR